MVSPPNHLQTLLPSKHLHLKSIAVQEEGVSVCSSTTSASAHCPTCRSQSKAIHSHYWRVLRDLPWQGKAVQLRIEVKRFRCRNEDCARRTFVEQVPAVTSKRVQQTMRFSETVRMVGYALGGEAGCRLARRIGLNTSADTVLRRTKEAIATAASEPRFIGVDDWAWRKGHSYGSILVDLEAHCPIALLPDRSGDTLAGWLKQHPTVQLISRDRAEAYADGARKGAPEAIQVADRFHLLCNLTSAVERVLERKRTVLSTASEPEQPEQPAPVPAEMPKVKVTHAQNRSEQRRQCRLERYNQVMALHRQGASQKAISRKLQIGRKTIRRFMRAGTFPERATPRRRPPRVNQFRDYLERRWKEGCHNATTLWREIQAQDYAGARSMVARLVSTFRTAGTAYDRQGRPQPLGKAKRRPVSPRQAAMLLARRPEKLTEADQQLLTRIQSRCPEVGTLATLVQEFSSVLRNKDAAALQPWIDSAKATGLPELKTFSDGLLRDADAVKAAITLIWSNGQVEGQVHRLKLIKRQMYGRASFGLLRSRVLPYSPSFAEPAQRAP